MISRSLATLLVALWFSASVAAQQNVGFQAAPAASTTSYSGVTTHYEKVPYYDSYGRLCYHYRQVSVPVAATQKVEPVTVTNPIGQQNTDNSVTYQYTYNISYGQFPAEQGSTVYGYPSSVFESADVYGNIDLGAQLNGMNRLASQLNSDGVSVANGLKDTIDRLGANQARIAEIQANKSAIVATLLASSEQTRANAVLAQALRAGDSLHYERRENVTRGDGQTTVTPDQPDPSLPAQPSQPSERLAAAQTLITRSCGSCHGATTKQGGLDLSQLRTLTPQQADKIVDRITTSDAVRRMPPVKPGHEPVYLSGPEIKTIIKAMN